MARPLNRPPNVVGMARLAGAFRRRRVVLGLSQAGLAERAGCSRCTVMRFEQGKVGSLAVVGELAEVLGLALAVVRDGEPFVFERPCGATDRIDPGFL